MAILGGTTNDLAASVSPDGRLLAFARSDARTSGGAFDGASDLFVRSLSSDDEHLVARDVWPATTWAPSGRSVLARTADGRALVIVEVGGAAAPLRIPVPGEVASFSWQALQGP
jgi:hypothetical protein